MGTGRPRIEITAATLAGGEKNQDRYAYGDGWAFVLDGASSFTKTQLEHDGGWYAEHLMLALTSGLTDTPERPTPQIVEDAIRVVAELHGSDAESCPTSTVALARWDHETVEMYLLGDSTAAALTHAGEDVYTDDRIAKIANSIREEYRSRLLAGHGFDRQHHELLRRLQAQQADARNETDGYWIAGYEPRPAHEAMRFVKLRECLRGVVLATDGVAAGLQYGAVPNWSALADDNLDETLRKIHAWESDDPKATRWPRSKLHDDKTVAVVHL